MITWNPFCFWMPAACLLWIAVQGPTAAPQAGQAVPNQTIRVRTELVELRAVVSDAKGLPVADLQKDDFELLENGQPQTISFFSMASIPGKEAAPAPLGASPILPVRTRSSEAPARSVVIVVDTLHLAATNLMPLKSDIRRFVDEQLTDRDLVALVTTSGSLGLLGQFTQDRRILHRAIDKIGPGRSSRASLFTPQLAGQVMLRNPEATDVAINIVRAEDSIMGDRRMLEDYVRAKAGFLLAETSHLRTSTLRTLEAAADSLSEIPGQRLVLFCTDGFSLMDHGGAVSTNEVGRVTGRAVRSGVVIYSIIAKGLQADPVFDASRPGVNDTRIYRWARDGEKELENGMNAVAKDTGGEAFFNTNDIGGSFQRALDDNRIYYLLAYHPHRPLSEGQFRRLTVRIRNRPDLRVRTSRGYHTTDLLEAHKDKEAESPGQKLTRAMLQQLPSDGIRVGAEALHIENSSDESQVSLRLRVGSRELVYLEEAERFHLSIEVRTMIFDSGGKRITHESHTVHGKLPRESHTLAMENGLNLTRRIAFKPGLYQIRIGILDPRSERHGTAHAWVDIPDPGKTPLSLSDILLIASDREEPSSPVWAVEVARNVMEAEGLRFRSDETLLFRFRILSAAAWQRADPVPEIRYELRHEGTTLEGGRLQPEAADQAVENKRGILVLGRIPLGNLDPGFYELIVTVEDPKARRAARRSVHFGIENGPP